MSAPVIALLAFCIAAEIARELCFKAAADAVPAGTGFYRTLSGRPLLWLGLTAWAVEVVAWVAVLQHAPLTLAFPVMTLTYAAIPMASALLLKERLGRTQMAGAALVAVGVICVGVSGRA